MKRLASATRSMVHALWRRHGADLVAVALVFVAYTLTLWVANRLSFAGAVVGGIANTIPVTICGLAARQIILRRLIGRGVLVQAAGHVILCVLFSLLTYWLLLVIFGVMDSPTPWNFVVKNFVVRGMAWQMLEDVTTYAVLAAWTYARAPRPEPSQAPVTAPAPSQKEPSRYLVRIGDELRPIDLDRIVSISGADDYAELSTLDGKRLVAMTLAEFEATLDPARFVRVHRSHIVNLDYVERAEPAGAGRLLLHMQTGEIIATSRTGARSLKTRVI